MSRAGKQTFVYDRPPVIAAHTSIVGPKEGRGPLCDWFDEILPDDLLGQKSWELAESEMARRAIQTTLDKAGLSATRAQALRRFVREVWYMLPISLLVALAVELLNHQSFEKLLLFLQGHPWMFLFNVEIIFNTFLFAELFRRRRGVRWLLGILWLVLGAVHARCAAHPRRAENDHRLL